MRVAIYARTVVESTSEVERQIRLCKSYTAAKDWNLVEVYYDFSKTRQEQDGLFTLLRHARKRTFDILLTPTVDCLSHDPDHLVEIGRMLRSSRITLATVDLGLWSINQQSRLSGDDEDDHRR